MKNLVIASLLAVTASAFAQTVSVDIKDPWVRPTVGQQSATGAFMQITASGPAKVISASSPVAGITVVFVASELARHWLPRLCPL